MNLPPERRGVGYVPRDVLLFPHLDVMGNVTAGARRARARGHSAFDPERVLKVIEVSTLRHRPVLSLSGGERQRVALARALCSAARLLMLDEPLASLDRPLRRRILPYLLRMREEFGLPVLHISRETTEVLAVAREVAVMTEGRLVAPGDPRDVLLAAAVLQTAGLEGVEDVIGGRVIGVDAAAAAPTLVPGLEIKAPRQDLQTGQETVFALRAEDLIFGVGSSAGLSAQDVLGRRSWRCARTLWSRATRDRS